MVFADVGSYGWLIKDTFNGFSQTFGLWTFGHWTVYLEIGF